MSRDLDDPQGIERPGGAAAERRHPRPPIDPTEEPPRPAGRAVGGPTLRDPASPIDPERSAGLVTAYVDGVAELPPDERHEVEALLLRDPGARAEAEAAHALLDRLRALPPQAAAAEPDWTAMERSIRQAVATAPTRPWWRRWQWLVPAMACATAAAVLLVIGARSAPRSIPQRPPSRLNAEPPAAEPPGEGSVVALWLDGAEIDVDIDLDIDLIAPDELGDVALDPGGAQAPPPFPQPLEDADEAGLLPPTDLAWVDTLDDAALDRLERWLSNPEDPASAHRRHDSQRKI